MGRWLPARWWSWTWAHRLTAALFLAVLLLGGRDFFPWFKGAATGGTWFQLVAIIDPLAGLEMILASGHLTTTLVWGLALSVGLALILGRVFCGWLCPLGLLLELNALYCDRLLPRLRLWGLPWPRLALAREWKYWLLVVCLAGSFLFGVPVFTTFSPINLLVLCLLFPAGFSWVIPAVVWALELFSPRIFCRALCPLGALLSLLGTFALLRVVVNDNPCSGCSQCSVQCPMGIAVMEEYVLPGRTTVADSECTRCGNCVQVCQGSLLHLGFCWGRDGKGR